MGNALWGPRLLDQEPWCLQPSQFGHWYDTEITDGLQDFKYECGIVIDKVVQVMYQHMPLNVKEVVKVCDIQKLQYCSSQKGLPLG